MNTISRHPLTAFIATLLLVLLITALSYTALHEGGHALAGLSFGGRITDFNVNFFNLGAHVGIDGKEYDECGFCRASCSSRDLFKEPDSGLPLKCDMCESDPPLEQPMCVQWCLNDALIYEEREEEVDEDAVQPEEMEIGLEALAKKYGLEKVMDAVARMSKKG